MYGAIEPGTDPRAVIIEPLTCARCFERYILPDWHKLRVPEWCPLCNDDILRSPTEEFMWQRWKGRAIHFFGWKFAVSQSRELPHLPVHITFVRLWKTLINPEKPGLEYSVSHCPTEFEAEMLPECCAWLIAHWWEHALNICPCQDGKHDDEQGSNFRKQMIQSLLWWHRQGFSGGDIETS